MVFLGLGLASLLYYAFSDNPNTSRYRYNEHNHDSGPPPNNPPRRYPSPVQGRRRRSRCSGTNSHENQETLDPMLQYCMICLCPIFGRDHILLRCAHSFHEECITQWMEAGDTGVHQCCPICRMQLH